MIGGLEEFIRERRLLQTCPLAALKDTRLGIDLHLYLSTLLKNPTTAEPFVAALGGAPLALISHIEDDLKILERSRIKPVFVLSGIPPAATRPHHPPSSASSSSSNASSSSNKRGQNNRHHSSTHVLPFDPRIEQRSQAWDAYEQGDVDAAQALFASSDSVGIQDLIRAVLRSFRHRNIEFLIAPYLASAQLVSLERHSKSFVHAIYASNELFLFDRVDRIILSLDLRKAVFTYASKVDIMAALGANEESFLDAALLAGFSACPIFPPLLDGSIAPVPALTTPTGAAPPLSPVPNHPRTPNKPGFNQQAALSPRAGAAAAATAPDAASSKPPGISGPGGSPNLKQIADIVRHYRSGFTVCVVFAEHPLVKSTEYTEQFCRARCMIKFSLVLHAEEGRVLPLPVATPPPPLPAVSSASSGSLNVTSNASAPAAGQAGAATGNAPAPNQPNATSNPATAGMVAPGVNGMTPAVPGSASTLLGSNAGPPILTAADVPKDLNEIFTYRLPDEVFLHLGRGMVSPTIFTYLTAGHIHEPAPLDNGETQEYKTFVRETITEHAQSPRCVAIALACSALHPFWHQRKVVATYWFHKANTNQNNQQQQSQQQQQQQQGAGQPPALQYAREFTVPHESKTTQELISRVKAWNVPVTLIEEELRRQNSSTIDIALCLGATISDPLAARTRTPRPETSPASSKNKGAGANAAAAAATPFYPLEKKDEIVANVIWRTLELRGFLNHNHAHTPYARALHLAIKQARVNDKLQEPLFLALELIRAGVLHASYYSGKQYSGGPAMGTTEERRHVLLIMRAFSLVSLGYKAGMGWDAPCSRELLAFNSFLKVLGRSMRHLVEMVACTLLLKGDARRARDDYLDIALSLPFGADANTGLGIVVKCYIEGLLTMHDGQAVKSGEENSEEVKAEKEDIVDMLGQTFENVKDVRAELRRGFRFWDALMVAVRTLSAEKAVSPELAQQFENANQWLAPMAVP
ncbi:hypothetical protein OC846_002000 [Tilletia horrida]|uniref:XPG-I domain-containing protein n=1 Tax=Tilletia horrida TaxID=155126 RepID=A0AAN6GRY7_9BASI|nr:hypothetical protein OC845_002183 [Tilletia horrida]KAK0554666.1 hypothetical protein OC846_002000 [Tilletia horrida]KAK0569830.1 hypothetical protein OC861_000541 [Tilletia horrida]